MQWESLGFKDEPFKTEPITAHTLDLYTGNEEKIKQCQFALRSNNNLMVIEGERGMGTTSFANYLRFKSQSMKHHFTPTSEIRVEPNWNADTLMAAIISHVVSTLELNHYDAVKNQPKFKEAKATVKRVSEIYRSFGATAFGFGANYGNSASISHPAIMPTPILSHYLEDLIQIIHKLHFKYGLIIQLNNLDVGTVQDETHFKMLLNVMRDYFQMRGTSWLLVGDTELRRFIAQNVDRVDDIISFENEITPLSEKEYMELIKRRVEYYRVNPKVNLPVDKEVWLYLYQITKGRLRYIFGLLSRLFNALQLGTLTDRITLDLAKPVVIDYAKERIRRFHLTATEELILQAVVKRQSVQVKKLAKQLNKKDSYISTVLSRLQNYRLVGYKKEWRSHHYYPSVDADIAYTSE